MGCLENWFTLPPHRWRQAWQDAEYSHSSTALTTSTSVPTLTPIPPPPGSRKAMTASMVRITLKPSASTKK